MGSRLLASLLLFFIALPLAAARVDSIDPASGPTSGGTTVTLKGDFWPDLVYGVQFGSASGVVTPVDAHTLKVVTPPHLPGVSNLVLFEYDIFEPGGVSFTFTGPVPDTLERILLPLLTPPSGGAFGSLFHVDFRLAVVGDKATAQAFGITATCDYFCERGADPTDVSVRVFKPYQPELGPANIDPTGKPGAFIYVPRDELNELAMNLRVFDSTRSTGNFGTELPIVRQRDFVQGGPITLIGVPTDPRFRNTLRIYATEGISVTVTITDAAGTTQRVVSLTPGQTVLEPAFASFSSFPVSDGLLRLTIEPPADSSAAIWAFVSVTNNDTQMISTISPRP